MRFGEARPVGVHGEAREPHVVGPARGVRAEADVDPPVRRERGIQRQPHHPGLGRDEQVGRMLEQVPAAAVGVRDRDAVRTLGVDEVAVGREREVPRVAQPAHERRRVELGRAGTERDRRACRRSRRARTRRSGREEREPARDVPARPVRQGARRDDARDAEVLEPAPAVEHDAAAAVGEHGEVGADRRVQRHAERHRRGRPEPPRPRRSIAAGRGRRRRARSRTS